MNLGVILQIGLNICMLDLAAAAALVQPAQIIDKTSKHYKTRHTVSKIKNEVF